MALRRLGWERQAVEAFRLNMHRNRFWFKQRTEGARKMCVLCSLLNQFRPVWAYHAIIKIIHPSHSDPIRDILLRFKGKINLTSPSPNSKYHSSLNIMKLNWNLMPWITWMNNKILLVKQNDPIGEFELGKPCPCSCCLPGHFIGTSLSPKTGLPVFFTFWD